MLEKTIEYWNDPRFSRERRLWLVTFLGIFVVLPVLFCVMFRDELREWASDEKIATATGGVLETAAAPPRALALADREIRAGNPGKAEEILRDAIVRKEDPAAAWRALGLILEQRGDEAGAAEAFGAAITLAPEATDFLHRGQCFFVLGKWDEAGSDFAEAVRLSPSNPIYTNRHYLYLLSRGEVEAVRNRMNLDIRLGVTNTMNGWVVAAAALALQEGKVGPAADLLSEAAACLPAAGLAFLLKDPAFDPYRQIPSLAPFLLKSAPPVSKATNARGNESSPDPH